MKEARGISEERERFVRDATNLESLIRHPGWIIIRDWIDAEKQEADLVLHSLEDTDTIRNLNAKFSYNFVSKLDRMIDGIISNKKKLLKALNPDGKDKLRRK